jgi:hypothetical protein
MAALTGLPDDYQSVRSTLHLVATHVLARARFRATGRFGLRVTWDGLGTPAFGPNAEVLRLDRSLLIHERQDDRGTRARTVSIAGRSLDELASFADVDLDMPFSAGKEAPDTGEVSTLFEVDPQSADALLEWFRFGAVTIDRVLPRLESPTVPQLWPEHFDIGCDAATARGRVNLGASPGDLAHPEPYLYVGPWEAERPGDPGFWNATFGAVLSHSDLRAAADALEVAASFLNRGLDLLG